MGKNYYIVLTINGKDEVYKVTREEQRFLLHKFEEPVQFTDNVDFWTISSRRRTQYETQLKRGENTQIPEKFRQMFHKFYNFPLSELKADIFKAPNGKFITTNKLTPKELLDLGAVPQTPAPGDAIYNHPDDDTPLGRVAKW